MSVPITALREKAYIFPQWDHAAAAFIDKGDAAVTLRTPSTNNLTQ